MGKLLETHPKLVSEHRDLIMECIDDADLSIRLRALDIVVGMVCSPISPIDLNLWSLNHLLPLGEPKEFDGNRKTTDSPSGPG
jgi:AP-3 complex subunit delta-1